MTVRSSATFDVPASVLYRSFLDQGDLMRMTRSQATMNPTVGGDWSLFNGSVNGKIISLEEGKRIVQTWKFANWAVESVADIEFQSVGPMTTIISVTQTGVPSHDRYGNADQDKLCLNGWEDKYWQGLATMLGYPRNKD